MTTPAQRIRDLVSRDTVLMPGVYDAITARIAARLGFEIVFISGYSVSAARLGEPDFGFLTESEMADAARAVTRVSTAPVIVDADGRGERDLFIVARTDARQPLGLDEAIARCLAYKEAGEDALFVEAPQSVSELEQIARELPPPLVANMIERGVTPHLTRTELKDLGFQLIVCPLAALYAATKAATKVLTELKEKETTAALYDELVTFDEFGELVEL